jgi:hypothetical protein
MTAPRRKAPRLVRSRLAAAVAFVREAFADPDGRGDDVSEERARFAVFDLVAHLTGADPDSVRLWFEGGANDAVE